MSERHSTTISPEFDKRIKIDFTGETLTSDAGALMLAELEAKLGVIRGVAAKLDDPRNPVFVVHTMESLLKQRIFSIAAGYEDGDDADELRFDPAMNAAAGKKEDDPYLASQPSISRLETRLLQARNLDVLKTANLDVAIDYYKRLGRKRLWLDIDSYESPVHGEQEGASWNGHYGSDCYHPLVLHDEFGLKLKVEIRAGAEYTSTGAAAFLEPVFKRFAAEGIEVKLTADSGFADPELYELCERYGAVYYIRLKSNSVLQRKAQGMRTRQPGRPPHCPLIRHSGFYYKADSWDRERRVVVRAVHPPGELFAELYFLVTNDGRVQNGAAFRRYHKRRGRAEQRNDEGKNTMFATRLSCEKKKANDARLQLYTLAYNFTVLFRLLGLKGDERKWTLNTIRLRLFKIGARITKSARRLRFIFSGGPELRRRVASIFNRIHRLPLPCQ